MLKQDLRRISWSRAFGAIFAAVVFTACARYITVSFEWRRIGIILREVDLVLLLGAGGASVLVYWAIRAARWLVLIRSLKIRIGFLDLYMSTAVSLSFALITPLSSGEAAKVELLRRYGMIGRFEGYSSFLIERGLDLLTVVLIACVSLLWTLDLLPSRSCAYWTAGGGLLAVLVSAFVLSMIRLPGRTGAFLDCVRTCLSDLKTLCWTAVLTVAGWCAVAVSWQIFLLSIGISLGFAQAMALMSVVAVAIVMSLIPGGLGIAETGIVQVLMHFGCDPSLAQSGALILRSYTIVALVLGVCHLGLWRLMTTRGTVDTCRSGDSGSEPRP